MLFSGLTAALVLLTSSVSALPQPPPTTNLDSLAARYPKSDLPPPDGLQLKYVLLGVGTQNYTCGSNETAPPGTTGAVAKLYDIGTRLNRDPLAQWKIGSITGLSLSLSAFPYLLEGYLMLEGYNEWLGNHFFTKMDATTSIPTFFLDRAKTTPFPNAMVNKKNSTEAPKTACPGTKNEGAVPWLRLVDDKGLSAGGVNTVYRVETAGGKQPAVCKDQKATFEIPYAAQYWVYGPKP